MRKFLIVIIVAVLAACSTKHNTWYSRHYQMLTSEFNVLFNGKEAFKSGIETTRMQYKNDYSHVLPIYEFSDAQTASSATSDMETALKKAHKLIQLHSITTKPEAKKNMTDKERRFMAQEEFNPLVNDAYLLIGKANVVCHEEDEAIEVLDYVARKFPTDKTAYESKIWKSIAFMQLGQPINAQTALESYDMDGLAPAELYGQFMAAQANIYIGQEKYAEAIHCVDEAQKNADCKHNRLRYRYILAQLYKITGQREKAAPIFLALSKSMGDYDMAFAAKMDLATVAQTPEELAQAEKTLNKMARDKKNEDQLDQIYYALGQMDENKGNVNHALINYQKSIDASITNTNQKGLSFLAMSDIYKIRPQYIEASTSADSAAFFLSDRNVRKAETKELSLRLAPLAEQLRIVRDEDSLMRLANMNSRDRDRVIQKILDDIEEKRRAEEEARAALEEEGMSQSDFYNITRGQNRPQQNTGGRGTSWYFYNTTMVNAGRSTFINKWGRRPNEDNWRRADKSTAAFSSSTSDSEDKFDNAASDAEQSNGEADESATENGQKEEVVTRESLMAKIPLTDSQKAEANTRIDDALFNSGILLYDNLKDYPSAIAQLDRLISRHSNIDCDNCYDALVVLYLAQVKDKRASEAQQTRNRILKQYPDSQFAKYLSNSNYFDIQAAEKAEKEMHYENAYSSYLKNNYGDAIAASSKELAASPEKEYTPKYLLIRALSYAKTAQTQAFRADLTEITQNYADGEEAEMAQKLLAKLDEGKEPVRATSYESPLANANNSNEETAMANKAYEYRPDTTHTIICVIDNGLQTEAQFTIADYNFTNYLVEDLDIRTSALADKRQIIAVSGFGNKQEAMNYFYAIRDKDFWKELTSSSIPEIYVVSDNNVRILQLSKSTAEYEVFFEENYLRRIGN